MWQVETLPRASRTSTSAAQLVGGKEEGMYWGYMGIMEKENGNYRDYIGIVVEYRVYIGVIWG